MRTDLIDRRIRKFAFLVCRVLVGLARAVAYPICSGFPSIGIRMPRSKSTYLHTSVRATRSCARGILRALRNSVAILSRVARAFACTLACIPRMLYSRVGGSTKSGHQHRHQQPSPIADACERAVIGDARGPLRLRVRHLDI